jgi:hypothetical protein
MSFDYEHALIFTHEIIYSFLYRRLSLYYLNRIFILYMINEQLIKTQGVYTSDFFPDEFDILYYIIFKKKMEICFKSIPNHHLRNCS